MKKKQKKIFSQEKAKKILKEKNPTLKGHQITERQRKLLGFIAGGGRPSKLK